MWTVVLDTTAIASDFRLTSTAMEGLLGRAKRKKLRIVVPEVVRREAIARFMEELRSADGKLERIRHKLARLGISLSAPQLDVTSLVQEYERYLNAHLDQDGIHIADPPEVPHLELVDRAIARARPFNDAGAGYRDALIWATVVECARSGDVAFVTDNHHDFADTDDEVAFVAKPLEADLFRIGEDRDRVIICRRPSSAMEYLFTRHEELLSELRRAAPVTSEKLLILFPPLLTLHTDPALGLPTAARVIEADGLEPLPELDYIYDEDTEQEIEIERDALQVTDASYIDSDLALVSFSMPVSANIEFALPVDAIDDRPGALRTYEVIEDEPLTADTVLCRAARDLDVAVLATYDTEAQKVVSATPGRVEVHGTVHEPTNAHLLGLQPGDRIAHSTFGVGTVQSIRGTGTHTEAAVDFDTAGEKHLVLAWAPVERVKDELGG